MNGSIRRECLDHIVVVGEQHLRHILLSYLGYYNAARTHLSLGKDAPVRRIIQRAGRIEARPVLGGLHHQYVRIGFSVGTTSFFAQYTTMRQRALGEDAGNKSRRHFVWRDLIADVSLPMGAYDA